MCPSAKICGGKRGVGREQAFTSKLTPAKATLAVRNLREFDSGGARSKCAARWNTDCDFLVFFVFWRRYVNWLIKLNWGLFEGFVESTRCGDKPSIFASRTDTHTHTSLLFNVFNAKLSTVCYYLIIVIKKTVFRESNRKIFAEFLTTDDDFPKKL